MSAGRDLLVALGPALVPAREVRYLPMTAFDDVTDDELETGARTLRALSYSCQEGAKLLEKILRARKATT